MIRAVSALLLAGLVLAFATTGEAAKPKSAAPAQPAAASDGLRGPQTPTTPARPGVLPTPRVAVAATPYPSALASTPLDDGSCRLTCARKYYFCLAGAATDECPGQWIQCRSACGAAEQNTPGER